MVVCLVFSLFPYNLCCFIFEKANEVICETTRTKEHEKKSGINKIKFIYQEIHEKGNIQIFSYSLLNIPLCVSVCVCN